MVDKSLKILHVSQLYLYKVQLPDASIPSFLENTVAKWVWQTRRYYILPRFMNFKLSLSEIKRESILLTEFYLTSEITEERTFITK